ncbi:MAG: response regulator, partial [Gammaproteobacteria bacterium]|nr:response regulator [Gammaproteobacteria bacterium]
MTIHSETEAHNLTERQLLLVDDEIGILRSLERALRGQGYQIHKANSGREGLELLEWNPIGVIVSDHRMPQMTGVEFLSQVKVRYPDTVRIVLSGYIDLKLVTDAINQGAIYKFFSKPWDDDLLRTNIKEAFEHYELRSENARLSKALQDANRALETINQELEQRVEQKSREVVLNLTTLQLSQELLENLPTAVIGVDDNGTIVLANHHARSSLL